MLRTLLLAPQTPLVLLVPLALTGCANPGPIGPDWEALSLTIFPPITEASLRGIAAWDEDVIWASGSAGTCVRTTDAGQTWTALQLPGLEERELRDIHLFGPDHALVLVVGSPAELWRTEDAGGNWRLVHRDDDPGMFMDSMDFWPNGRGLCFGDPVGGAFTIWVSDPSGEAWAAVPAESIPAPHPNEAGFAASGTLVRCLPGGRALVATGGGAARVLETNDYGVSWEAHDTPMAQGGTATGSFSIGVTEGDSAVLVGGDYTAPQARAGSAAYSVDGGRHWAPAEDPQPGYRSCVQAVPGSRSGTWLAIGKGGFSRTEDGGRSWTGMALPGHYTMAFVPYHGGPFAVAYLAGAAGALARLEIPCGR
jgi:photosystem II stability/assembly factor-like uncharacterized protein